MLEIHRLSSGADEHSLNATLVGRAKVPEGWLIFVTGVGGEHPSVCFYPDPDHNWSGSSLRLTAPPEAAPKAPKHGARS